jgi:diguanylate cyclase (GGDEF)-like protein/PAS domain S-box-containing protein
MNPPDAAALHVDEPTLAKGSSAEIESYLYLALNNTSDMITVLDADATIRYVSPAAERILGYSLEELVGTVALDYVHPEDIEFLSSSFAEALENPGVMSPIEFRLRRADGSWRHVEVIRNNQLDNPAVQDMVTTTRDVTERQRSEVKLRQSEERLRRQYNSFPIPTFSFRKVQDAFELVDYNKAADRITLGRLTGLLGVRASEWYSDHPQILEMLSHCFSEGTTISQEIPWRMRTTGEHKHFAVTFAYVPPDLVIHYAEDITERKQAEEEVRLHAKMLDVVGQAVIATDLQGKILYWNHAAENLYGWSVDEVMGRSILEVTPSEEMLDRAEEIMSSLIAGGSWSGQFEMRRKDGTTFPAMVTDTLLHDEQGNRVAIIGVSTDITEIKKTEELRRSEERFRSLVQNSSDVITIADADGIILYDSPAVERVLGYEPEERVGTNTFEYLGPSESEQVTRMLEELLTSPGTSLTGEMWWPHKEGSFRYLEVAPTNLLEDPAVRGIVINWRDVTERKRAEEALRESEERYRSLVELSPDAILVHSEDKLVYVNTAGAKLLGAALPDELIGKPALDLIHPDYREIARERVRLVLTRGKQAEPIEEKIVCLDGRVIDAEVSGSFILYQGKPAVQNVIRDITERKEAEERLREAEERYRLVARATNEVIWDHDLTTNAHIWDGAVEAMFGYSAEDIGLDAAWWEERIHPEDRERVLSNTEAALRSGGETWTDEYRFRCADGSYVTVVDRAYLMRDAEDRSVRMLGSIMDVTERKRAEERLHHQAYHDLLTDLPNRQLFMDRLKQALRRTRRRAGRKKKVAVLFMDLDNCKVVNDSLGHELGDRLLVAVGERLRGSLRPEDTLVRFGGDEFTVLVEDAEDPADAARVAERIMGVLREPFVLMGRELFVKPSIGIALGDARTTKSSSAEDLLRDADAAMYRAKGEGVGYRVFEPAMYEQAQRRLRLENELRRAIGSGEFVVCYQPIVDLRSDEEAWGMEALVRWNHPERGLLDPEGFVPAAEESGLVVPMGEWVLKEACKQAKGWQERHPRIPPLVMAVNLSARQLRRPDLASVVEGVLKESGLEASSLSLDITETVYIKGLEEGHTAALDELKRLGVRISIDDFGTGYSSLSYLKRLPADALKMDRSFVRGLGEDIEDTALVKMIVDLAHTFGMEVVAEGVESGAQARQLKEMGCDLAQGFHFAEALPAEAASEFLAR